MSVLPDFTALSRAAGRGNRRPQVLIKIIKLLHGWPHYHSTQELNREDLCRLLGTDKAYMAMLMSPNYPYARERDDLIRQAGWESIRRKGKQWFVREL